MPDLEQTEPGLFNRPLTQDELSQFKGDSHLGMPDLDSGQMGRDAYNQAAYDIEPPGEQNPFPQFNPQLPTGGQEALQPTPQPTPPIDAAGMAAGMDPSIQEDFQYAMSNPAGMESPPPAPPEALSTPTPRMSPERTPIAMPSPPSPQTQRPTATAGPRPQPRAPRPHEEPMYNGGVPAGGPGRTPSQFASLPGGGPSPSIPMQPTPDTVSMPRRPAPQATKWQEMTYEDYPASAYSSSGDLQRQMGRSARDAYRERIENTNRADREYADWRRSGDGGQRPDSTIPAGPGFDYARSGAIRDWQGPEDPIPNMTQRWRQVPTEAPAETMPAYSQPPQPQMQQPPMQQPPQQPMQQPRGMMVGAPQPPQPPQPPPPPQPPQMSPPPQPSFTRRQPPQMQQPKTIGRTTTGAQMPKTTGNAAMGSGTNNFGGGGMKGLGAGGSFGFKSSAYDLGKAAAAAA
jgi:hypothetical protein